MLEKFAMKIIDIVFAPVRYIIRKELQYFHKKNNQDIGAHRQRKALHETVEYVNNFMSSVDSVSTPNELLSKAWSYVERPGLVLEFGVFKGNSINHIASLTNYTVYGFDSFEGLPERWRDGFGEGIFKVSRLPDVKANVQLIKGWFEKTLPAFVEKNKGFVAFLHIDCDLYSSTKTVFECLAKQIAPGTVIVFDEYLNYPGWQDGEFKAFKEFLHQNNLNYQYIGYNKFHEQVAVKILKKNSYF